MAHNFLNMLESSPVLLAQIATPPTGGTTPPGGGSPGGAGRPGGGSVLLPGLLLAIVVFYIVLFRGQHKTRKETEQMLTGLQKNDRIVTIGGIVGTVVAIKGDDVIVKVDESNNTKMTFVRKAIQRVIKDEGTNKQT